MAANKLQVQRFRTNDLLDNGGKQFEIGRSWCEDFFEIPTEVGECVINLTFKALNKSHINLNDKVIELKLANVTNRGDRKAYVNGESGRSQIKDFFIDDLGLTVEKNLQDYFAVYKKADNEYYLYFVPKPLYDNFISIFKSSIPNVYVKEERTNKESSILPRQIIYYGAPGTGKSNRIDELTDGGNRIRTTFHPDSDYSTFVGAYKPTMKRLPRYNPNSGVQMGEEEKIVYQFVPQAFLKAYVAAWKRKNDGNEEPFYLVIEEINRGNCAQIFGDLFQLLDRDETGQSKYAICPDDDIRRYLQEAFNGCENLDNEIKSGAKMLLPPNLYIWATMNTSDQSLFPIDSAFKRRWDWEYMPIEDAGKGHVIEIGAKRYDWWKFISQINDKIGRMTSSEDKKLGYWFVIPANGGTVITAKQLVSKVLFYLWNDVYKDYAESSESIFKITDENGTVMDAPFTSFFGKDAEQRLQGFMAYNGIDPIEEEAAE